jgi:hypothetical protein
LHNDYSTPDRNWLAHLVREVKALRRGPVNASVESMKRGNFVHDTPELRGWEVDIADALKVRGRA